MNLHKRGVICSKSKLWKRKAILKSIVDYMLSEGYEFLELVYGEPNNFVFADQYNEIEPLLKRKGFFGIRIKFKNENTLFEINSNTNGVDNVKYDIYSENDETLNDTVEQLEAVSSIIGSSNEALIKSGEFLVKQRKIRNIVLLVLLLIGLYFLNVHIFLFNLVSVAYSFIPFLFLFLIIDRFRRR